MTKINSKITVSIAAGLVIALGILLYFRSNEPKTASINFDNIKSAKLSEETILPLTIDTNNKTINTAEVYLRFDPKQIEVLSVSNENSIFKLWVTNQPSFSNEKGEIAFAGGLPTPGFNGKGQVGSIKIKPKESGNISFDLTSDTRALLNDGLGTAISLNLVPITIKVDR